MKGYFCISMFVLAYTDELKTDVVDLMITLL